MPAKKEELLLNAFLALVEDGWRGFQAAELPGTVAGLEATGAVKSAAAGLAEASPQAQLLASYTNVVASSPVYQASQGGSGEGTVSKVAKAVFGNALGMVPFAKAIFSLFGGGGAEEPPALVKFALPSPMRFEAASAGGNIEGADYGQDGLPRAYGAGYISEDGAQPPTAQQSGPQVTIQVQAMDSRSFLDHKDDIARAVREAMLNMHSLNDVVSEL